MRVLLLHFWREKMHPPEVSPAPARMHPALRPALLLPCCLQLHPWVPILSIRGIIIRTRNHNSVPHSVSFSFLFFFYLFKISIRRHWRRSRGTVSKMIRFFIYFLVCSLRMNLCFVRLFICSPDIKYLMINITRYNKVFYILQTRKILRIFWGKVDLNSRIDIYYIVIKYIEEKIYKQMENVIIKYLNLGI